MKWRKPVSTGSGPGPRQRPGTKGKRIFYWSYKLLTDTVNEAGWVGWDSFLAGALPLDGSGG